MNILFLDTETNGLPPMKNGSYVNPKKVKKYNEARVIEMNWMIMDENQQKVKSNKNKINEEVNIGDILIKLNEDIKHHKIKKIVCYNAMFHYHVVIAETYRAKNGKLLGKLDFINHKPKIRAVCSMQMAMKYLDIENKKFPKLDELYKMFFKKEHSKKLIKNIQCFYLLKKIKEDATLIKKYNKKYNKYLEKIKK